MFDILQVVDKAATIGISGHIRPDGDCVGSTLALMLFLQKQFPKARVDVFLEQIPEVFQRLHGAEQIRHDFVTDIEVYDVFFCLDSVPERMGAASDLYEAAGKKINIDHHISNPGAGDVNLIVPTASSTSELIYELIKDYPMDAAMAEAIYVGIIHDTGVFQYSCTSSRTMEIGAKLIGFGFDFSKMIAETFYEKTYLQTQIMGRALLESIQFMDGRCNVSCIDKKTMDFYGVQSSDLDGIVNQLLNVKGVDCAIFMYQLDSLEYKVSLRSNEKVDVSKVAQFFGGGGHMRAAGATMHGTFHDCINNLSLQIAKQLQEEQE